MPKYQINWYPIHISGFDEDILAPVVVHNGRAFVFDGGLVETSVVSNNNNFSYNKDIKLNKNLFLELFTHCK